MDISKLYTLQTDIARRLVECDDVNLLLNIYKEITGEAYPEEDIELLLKEAELEYELSDSFATSRPFERIPGLPYTHEERMEALRQAEKEIENGLGIPHEEVMKEIDSWLSNGYQQQKSN